MSLQIACDGSCIQQGTFRKGDETDRPGAAGFVARLADGRTVWKTDPYPNGTIGTMEVVALRMGLEFARDMTKAGLVPEGRPVTIVCDSQYAVNGYNEWLAGWAAKNYHKKGGLANADEWRSIDVLKKDLGQAVQVIWTKGHGTHPLNNAVDSLVNAAARSQRAQNTLYLALRDTRPAAPAFGSSVEALKLSSDDKIRLYDAVPNLEPVVPEALGAPETASGIRAQAATMLARAADDPQLASLIADGIELALDERRLVARYNRDTVDEAQSLQQALERRGRER